MYVKKSVKTDIIIRITISSTHQTRITMIIKKSPETSVETVHLLMENIILLFLFVYDMMRPFLFVD